jgi:hypothetical protein
VRLLCCVDTRDTDWTEIECTLQYIILCCVDTRDTDWTEIECRLQYIILCCVDTRDTDWTEIECTLQYIIYFESLSLNDEINILEPSGHYMYHQFNIQQFLVLPIQCIYVFCVDLRTNSDYFPIQH